MDYFLKRQRHRLIGDLIDLEYEEDLERRYQSIDHNFKESGRRRIDSEDDEYRNYHHRRKEYCLVTVTYHGPNNRRKHVDDIMITQHNRIIYKGCLKYGDQFAFKSKRYRNECSIKFNFYINDLCEYEMIGCCEHGLVNKNKRKHLFHIEHVVGSKSCNECQIDDDTITPSSSTPETLSRQNSFRKNKNSSTVHRLLEDQSDERRSKKKYSRRVNHEISHKKASSEGFAADVLDLSNYTNRLQNESNGEQKSEEDVTESLPIDHPSPPKRKYGPPQLSMMSVSEAPDSPTISHHEHTTEYLFNSTAHPQPDSVSQTNSNFNTNENRSNQSRTYTRQLPSIPSQVESNSNERDTSFSLNNSNEMAIANDATQLLLTRLGILRQQQIERPVVSAGVIVREKGNVEYFALVYLHSSYPDEIIIKQLRSRVNYLKIFNDIDDCVAFINGIIYEKIIFILSNSFCNAILPRIEELQQIYTIYILHENEDDVDFSSTQSKIQGFYTNINDIYDEITNNINKISRDLIIYLNISSNAVALDPMFLYFQLLTEVILDRNEIGNGLKELIDFSRGEYEGNDEELKIIEEFENTYQKKQAMYWFSRKCFLSKMLNKGLRVPEADILYKLRVFIQDLCQQMENESVTDALVIYLAQTIQRNDLDDLQKNILDNNLIVFPQFLFGSTDQSRAIRIANEIPRLGENFISLLIRIDVPEDFQCANMSSLRYSLDEDNDVLLNMNIIGRLTKVEKDDINEDQIACVHITLIKREQEQNIQQLIQAKQLEVKSFSPFATLIKLMVAMNQQTSAEQIVEKMFDNESLKQEVNIQSSIAASLHILATSHRNQDNFQRAVELYLLSLETFLRIIPPNALELSTLYINIATMYFRLDKYEQSHEYYQKGLHIHLNSNTPDLYSVSNCTNSIGIVYLKQGLYTEAIKSFERTLKILLQIPESHESEIALTYDNIGDAYLSQGKHEDALNNYCKSLEIQEGIEPCNPQTLGSSYHTIGNIYLKLGRCKEALNSLKRALEYQQQYLPLTHPAFALLYNNIGLMHYRIEEYTEALQCYSKSLEIAAISLPENHSMIGITLFNIALVYSSQDKYDEAIESIEKSTIQFLKTLAPDHPDILENQSYVESIRRKKMLKNLFEENTTTTF